MKFIKAGEIADSNIFNKLDERKKSLYQFAQSLTDARTALAEQEQKVSARSRSSKAAWTSSICPSARRIFSRAGM